MDTARIATQSARIDLKTRIIASPPFHKINHDCAASIASAPTVEAMVSNLISGSLMSSFIAPIRTLK
jgi:hypothetical protein